MPERGSQIDLSLRELRDVVAFAAACARPALLLYERERAGDSRPRAAIDASQAFVDGVKRTKSLRDSAWAALRAATEARDAGQNSASEAARAAVAAAGAGFLHPVSRATQVKHIVGAAAHTARAFELLLPHDPDIAEDHIRLATSLATPTVVSVLLRYPMAPAGGGRVGELIRQADAAVRSLNKEPSIESSSLV